MDLTNEDIPSTRKVNYAGCAGDLTDLNGKLVRNQLVTAVKFSPQIPSRGQGKVMGGTVEPVIQGNRYTRSIVYGSLAVPIKKPETDHTHKWSVYVRGYNGEDISYYVKRVSFKLHDSFAQPIRNIDEAPFEVNETGWGEFQIQIKITFQDPSQRPVTINHNLRLHPSEDLGQLKTSKPVLSEFYDELIFDPATEMMEGLLQASEALSDPTKGPKHQELLEEEKKEIDHIDSVIELIKVQLEEVNDKLAAFGPVPGQPPHKKRK